MAHQHFFLLDKVIIMREESFMRYKRSFIAIKPIQYSYLVYNKTILRLA